MSGASGAEPPVREIDVAALRERLASGPPLAVVDVREPDEVATGMIHSALHVPLGELAERIGELPAGEVAFICRGGGRSARACRLLASHGRADTLSVAGGMTAWQALPGR